MQFYKHQSKFMFGQTVRLEPPTGVIVGISFQGEEPTYDVRVEGGQVIGGIPESDILGTQGDELPIEIFSQLPGRGDISFAEQLAAGDPEFANASQLDRDLAFAAGLEGEDAIAKHQPGQIIL